METKLAWIVCGVMLLAGICACQNTLQVVWMAPYRSHKHTNFIYNASSSVAALALGLQTIERDNILPNHVLNITYIDSECNSKQSLGQLVDLMFQQPIDVVIGPPCADVVVPIGELMSYKNIPMMNWVSLGQTIAYKDDLTTYFRSMAPITSLGGIMMMFYYYTGWRRFVIISSDGNDYRSGAETVTYSITNHTSTGFMVAHHYESVRIRPSDTDIDTILMNVKHEARVIILLVPRGELRQYMLRAAYLGMTDGTYQFLFIDTQLAGSDDIALLKSDKLWKRGDASDEVAKQAFHNVLYFVLGHNTQETFTWRDEAETAYDNMFGHRLDMPRPTELDEFSAYLHDTLIYYARLYNSTLSLNRTIDGNLLYRSSVNANFKGLSGDVIINALADRQPAFLIYDMDVSGVFQQVASLQYALDDMSTKIHVNSTFTKILWGDGRSTDDSFIPPDTPACGFFNELCDISDYIANSKLDG